jgi:hypothetical protein
MVPRLLSISSLLIVCSTLYTLFYRVTLLNLFSLLINISFKYMMVYCIEPELATNPRSDTGATSSNTAYTAQHDESGVPVPP